ncbi:MAG: SCO family protein [Gammaproteobacteria bacterium]|jgi:protein SCO1|nr:SCO family protein [Gammaproteobacteria bacterium]MBT4494626.1 SCO family protein [Gammaproteobacteria bacterium]MBT7369751.1 SCO family protein [Gammaproteobacteria bacterium]
MDPGIRNTLFGIAAFIAVIVGLFVASVLVPRPMSDEQVRELGYYRFENPRPISDFKMVDHTGKPVGIDSFRGTWSLIFFGFTTCPDVCPTTLSVLAEATRDLDHPPQVVMVTVDPDRDTADLLRDYVPAFHPDFRGFVGSFDETVRLAEQLNVAFGKVPGELPETYLVDHTASIVVINPEARYAGFIKAPDKVQNIQRILPHL